MPKKKKHTKPPAKSFKVITRKLQKRKDGKKVYSYWNKTDGTPAKREDWVLNDNIKKDLRSVYGKEGAKKKFAEDVREVKSIEKKQLQSDNTKLANEIEEYRKEYEFSDEKGQPRSNDEYIFNQGIVSRLEDYVAGMYSGNFLVKADGKYYLPTEKNLLEFRMYVNDLMDWFFEKIKEEMTEKQLSANSPFVMFNLYMFINEDFPNLWIFDLDRTQISENVPYLEHAFLKEQKKLQRIYFESFRTVNIYNYIKRNGKVKAEKPKRKKRKTRKKNK